MMEISKALGRRMEVYFNAQATFPGISEDDKIDRYERERDTLRDRAEVVLQLMHLRAGKHVPRRYGN